MKSRKGTLQNLLIFSLIICLSSFTGEKKKRYVITDYGAVAGPSAVNTRVIQQVIDRCAAGGGGTVVVPSGVFLSGALFFRQGVSLYLEEGGVLKGTVDENDYPIVDTRWEGIERKWVSAFINAFDLDGFKITGEGMIDGSGVEWLAYRDWRELRAGRPRLIAIQNCRDVLVSGITLKNQACWGLFVLYSRDVVIENLTIRAAHNIPMSDGIDIDSSTGVYITRCDIDVNDDCIAIKSGKDEDGRRVNRPARDIVVEKCRFRYGHGGVSMGSEMSGGIHNVEVRDCIMEADNWAPIRFKSQPGRGGVVEDITYRDLILNNTRQAVEFNMEWRMRPPVSPPSDPLPVVRNINIINVSGTVGRVGVMHGLEGSPIKNVSFKNCHIEANKGLVLEHVEGLVLSGLHLTVEEGEPVIRRSAREQQSPQALHAPSAREVSEQFKDPPVEYSMTFYWGWDGNVTEEVIARDLDEYRSKNVRIVTLEPGYEMGAPYLSPGWFEKVKTATRLARERDMRVYLVDEGKYPSGFAGGRFSSEAPELRMQALVTDTIIEVRGNGSITMELPPEIVGAAAFNKADSTTQFLEIGDGKLNWTAPAGEWQVILAGHAYRTSPTRSVNNPDRGKDRRHSLMDYLDPEAARKFIEFTHEGYREYVGEEFGRTILGFRGDEPDYSIRGLPWTPALFNEFEKRKGYDVAPYAASLLAPVLPEEQKRIRADYWDVWSAIFAENFFRVQADWCAAHHLEYLVHLNHEDKMIDLVRSEGDFFRAMRPVQMPGVDAIWHQIWPGESVPVYPKFASSAAHLYGKPRSFTESFAAYRPRPDIYQAKWILDHQLVRGINMVEVMFVPASTRNQSGMRGWLADEKFPDVARYIHRACYLLSMGAPAAGIAVYFPTGSIWLGDEASHDHAIRTMERLLELQRDFDVVDEASLESILTLEKGRFVNLSGQGYSVVLVPSATAISKKALTRLEKFQQS
ncbi:MAG: right-handed parallel beta-helix repeat-containing protein, partial [Bacteroidales bacterium]|nr:right-handed parallel beta-helix repeat-containing protein [Bacteroidales bacterium]